MTSVKNGGRGGEAAKKAAPRDLIERLAAHRSPKRPKDVTHEQFVVGPRVVGGRYRNGYWGNEYTVLAIDLEPAESWKGVEITVEREDGSIGRHGTAWNYRRDSVISLPDVSS